MDSKGILRSLFDFSFTHFITPLLQRWLYIGLLLWSGFGTLSVIASIVGMAESSGEKMAAFLIALPVGVLMFLACAVMARVSIELVAVVFRGVEYLQEINERQRAGRPTGQGD